MLQRANHLGVDTDGVFLNPNTYLVCPGFPYSREIEFGPNGIPVTSQSKANANLAKVYLYIYIHIHNMCVDNYIYIHIHIYIYTL